MQAAIIAVVLGTTLRHTSPTAPTAWWPYLLAAYGLLAALVPWHIGGFYEDEFELGPSLFLGVIFALPLALAGHWLVPTPYRVLGRGCWIMASLWFLHLGVSIRAARRP